MNQLSIALEKVDFLPVGRVTDDTSILTLKTLVFEPLCRWENGVVHPALFSRWEHSPDGRRWRFEVRPDAVFHDGRPCTAQEIVAYVETILHAVDTFGMKWSYARYLADARFTIPSPGILVVENPTPLADILDIFSEFYIARPDSAGRSILGTGPYRVTTFTPRESVTLEPARAGGGPARIIAMAIPDADDRYAAVAGGSVDAALNLERASRRLDGDQRLQWGRATNTLSVMYYLNCFKGVFTSPLARRAINHAVDAQMIVDELFHGLGIPSSTIVSPFHLGHAAARVAPIPYDRDMAKALFEQAGASDDLVIRTPEHMPEKAVEISRVVQHALSAIGIRARLDIQPDRPEYAREVGRKEIGDMAIFDSSPHSTYRILNDKISSAVRAVWWQGHDDPPLEALIRSANHAVAPADREAAYGRCLARLNANPPWLYLFHPVEIFAARSGISGLTLDTKGVLNIAM